MTTFRKCLLAVLLLISLPSWAQGGTPSSEQLRASAEQLVANSQVKAAFAKIDANKDAILKEWIALTEINSPSSHEQQRSEYVMALLRKMKLDDVHMDKTGNIIAVRKGASAGPAVVIDAHLDTVFQPGRVIKAEIRDGRIYAPGVGDDTRNVEALLAIIRALDSAKIKTKRDIWFTFTVQEETTMNGVEALLAENKSRFGDFIALDGGYEGFNYGGTGVNWYKHHIIGPGGHTKSDTPPYSASLPLSRAIARIYELNIPKDPPTFMNIGMLGGSEVPNAKAADAWMSLDLRSTDDAVLKDLDAEIAAILKEEAERVGMTVQTEIVSATPAAQIPGHRNSNLVRTTEAVYHAMGFADPPIGNAATNHVNNALRAGVPAVATGAGSCEGSHSVRENCDIASFYIGVKKAMAITLAMAQLDGK
ncbi:MAG: Acetylornithine deacetylase/succinyldiaminopimelate desuccinylase-like deacylase [Acidobacteriales bacterium]|nr:Acetylornithine deacetylase/succinyldiaminopimelate desuccinylase-like deacylase [Terriglobales bacterium]